MKELSGNVTNRNLEPASPTVLIGNGRKRNSIKSGGTVSVTGIQAKDSSNSGSASVFTFRGGRKLNFLVAEEPTK